MSKNEEKFGHKRIAKFPNEHLEVSREKKLHCKLCNVDIEAEKASTVKNQVISAKHKKNSAATKKNTSIVDSLDGNKWDEMLTIYLGAGIPLHVFRNEKLRNWMKKHVKHGHSLPSETSFRRVVKKLADKDEQDTIKWLKEKNVIVMADETTDLLNRKVLHILVAPATEDGKFRIASTTILQNECNSAIIANAVADTIRLMEVPPDRVVCFKSDNAPYMCAAGCTLKGLYPRILHSTFWSHIIHLVGEEIRTKLKTADAYIAAFKASLVKSPLRRQQLMEIFKTKNLPQTLPPVPVITRWATWVKTGSFRFRYLDAEFEWIGTTDSSGSAAIAKLKKLVNKVHLLTELQQVDQICDTLASTITTLESNNLPASDVWLELKTLDRAVKQVFKTDSSKLTLYMTAKQPARTFWNECQYFDPRKASEIIDSDDPEAIPASLRSFDTVGVSSCDLLKYKEIRKTQHYDASYNPFKFWKSFQRELPVLSDIAIRVLSIPCSSAEVERSFSALKRLLTPQRTSFTEENLAAHVKMMFNQNRSAIEELTVDLSDEEDESEE